MKTTTQKGFKKLPEMVEQEPIIVRCRCDNGIVLDEFGREFMCPVCDGFGNTITFPELKFIEGEFCK